MPIHEHGNTMYQEIKSMQAVLSGSGNLENLRADSFGITLLLQGGGTHSHEVPLSPEDVGDLQAGAEVTASSTLANGHTHSVKLKLENGNYILVKCNDANPPCSDGHDTLTYTVI